MTLSSRIENKSLKAHIVKAGYGVNYNYYGFQFKRRRDYECNWYYTTK
jgi:hypothetical protein